MVLHFVLSSLSFFQILQIMSSQILKPLNSDDKPFSLFIILDLRYIDLLNLKQLGGPI